MIRNIMKDETFLAIRSRPATKADKAVGQDLLDTLKAHASTCVGMAANMIGVSKNIIAVHLGFMDMLMYNPVIEQRFRPYETEEGCLSLKGQRKTTRYDEIIVSYQDETFHSRRQTFTGFAAEIIQHEVDHLNGIII